MTDSERRRRVTQTKREITTHLFPLEFLYEFNKYQKEITQDDVLKRDSVTTLVTNLNSFIAFGVSDRDWDTDKVECANNITAVCIYALYSNLVATRPDHWKDPYVVGLYFKAREIEVTKAERRTADAILKKIDVKIADKNQTKFTRPDAPIT